MDKKKKIFKSSTPQISQPNITCVGVDAYHLNVLSYSQLTLYLPICLLDDSLDMPSTHLFQWCSSG